jgi:hypothetical protein
MADNERTYYRIQGTGRVHATTYHRPVLGLIKTVCRRILFEPDIDPVCLGHECRNCRGILARWGIEFPTDFWGKG